MERSSTVIVESVRIMPRLSKVVFPLVPMLVTTSIEEGLPMVPTSYMKVVIKSALARAQTMYPVTICAYLFEPNHAHLLIFAKNPDDVMKFMGRIKTEIAHAINKFQGCRHKTVWCDGYDSPSVLTVDDVIKKLVYIYTNPAKDNLVDSIEDYPHLNTLEAFNSGGQVLECPWIHRPQIDALSRPNLSPREQDLLAERLVKDCTDSHKLVIEPDAWMQFFNIKDPRDVREINLRISKEIKAAEAKYREIRKSAGTTVIGREAMIRQPINKPYQSNRIGRRCWCHCSNVSLRIAFIQFIKGLVAKGKEVLKSWRQFDFSAPYPLGLYPPSLPKRGNYITKAIIASW